MGQIKCYAHGDVFIDVASKNNYYNFIKKNFAIIQDLNLYE